MGDTESVLMRPQSREPRVSVGITMSLLLKAELEAEAWESSLTLTAYIRKLLSSRGKFERTVGQAGGYLIGPTQPRKHK